MYSEPIDVLRGLKAGASDYISKCADTDELLAAIYWALDDLQKSGRHCVVHRSGDNFMLWRTPIFAARRQLMLLLCALSFISMSIQLGIGPVFAQSMLTRDLFEGRRSDPQPPARCF